MKIFFVSDYYPPYIKGGAEVSTSLLADWLVKENSIMVACSRLAEKPWIENGISVYPVINKVSLDKKDFKSVLFYGIGIIVAPIISAIKIIRLISQYQPDVINVVPSSYQFIPIILALYFFSQSPIVVDVRDASLICPTFYGKNGLEDTQFATHGYRCLSQYEVDNFFIHMFIAPAAIYESIVFNLYKSSIKFISSRSKRIRIVAVSEFMRQQLILNGFQADVLSVINNIAPKYESSNLASGDAKILTFAYAGRIEEGKGIFDLLAAAKILQGENFIFNLTIAGKGPDLVRVENYIKNNNLQNINLIGHIKASEVLTLYSEASVVIGPSRAPEPFGRFILESVSVGRPVITVRFGGAIGVVDEGVTGLLFEPGNSGELANAMKYFIEHPEKVRAMRDAIVEKQKQYSASFIGGKRLELYRSLLEKRS